MPDDGAAAHDLGRRGEELAARFLTEHGLRIIARNVHLPSTEFDLVAQDEAGLAFVEVKTRSTARFGYPYEAVQEAKRRRMARGALEFMESRQIAEVDYRFAIVSVLFPDPPAPPRVEWIEEA